MLFDTGARTIGPTGNAHDLTSIVNGRRCVEDEAGVRGNEAIEVRHDAVGIQEGMAPGTAADDHTANRLIGIIDAGGDSAEGQGEIDHGFPVVEKRLEPGIVDIPRPTDNMPEVVDGIALAIHVTGERAQVDHPDVLLPEERV